MNGRARTTAAVTITNALTTGVGCAVGIELHVAASVSISEGRSGDPATWEVPPASRSPVVEEALRTGLAQYYPRVGVAARVDLRSDIPVARGLKSSSAVSTALLLAIARSAGRTPTAIELGRLSARVGRDAGVSATGALDDALAGLDPGLVVTDNTRGEVLRRFPFAPGLGVALYIPNHTHPPSPNLRSAFAAERAAGETSALAATHGDWSTAMRLNTQLVERTMGYSYGELRDRLRSRGAIASGVSGLGPALAAIAPTERLDALVQEMPTGGARTLVVPFSHESALEGGAR